MRYQNIKKYFMIEKSNEKRAEYLYRSGWRHTARVALYDLHEDLGGLFSYEDMLDVQDFLELMEEKEIEGLFSPDGIFN